MSKLPDKYAPAGKLKARSLATENHSQRMIKKIAAQPDIRPESLARARKLATDPDYPPADVVTKVAERLIEGPASGAPACAAPSGGHPGRV